MDRLQKRLIRLLSCNGPMRFSEIEEAVGKQGGFALGITLNCLVKNGAIHYTQHQKGWNHGYPVYSFMPVPKGFVFEARNAKDTGGAITTHTEGIGDSDACDSMNREAA